MPTVTRRPEASPQDDMRLEVWSFNLRTEFQDVVDGPDGWTPRRCGVADLIRTRRPALVCTQEATEGMLAFLVDRLGAEEYAWIGTSRRPGVADETVGLLYDRRRLELIEHESAWLGPPGTPPGLASWDAALPRTLETAVFRLRTTSGASSAAYGDALYLRALNTHFDHVGVDARHRSGAQLADAVRRGAVERRECAQVVTGDFNSTKGGSSTYAALLAGATGLRDAAREAEERSLTRSTIHKFQGAAFTSEHGDGTVELGGMAADVEPDAHHIDWLLWRDGTGLQLRPVRFEVITTCLENGRYPSDHFPVSVVFELLPKAAARAKL